MDSVDQPPEPSGDMNFDKADFGSQETSVANCAVCRGPLDYQYYEVNKQVICPSCKDNLETQMEQGKGAGRYMKAFLLGLPAGIVGAGIYYAIMALTGYEFGLIAILIGYMVGIAVRYGSNHRGGIVLQLMAAVITYFAICSTYVPLIIEGMQQEWDMEELAMEEGGELSEATSEEIGSMSKDEAEDLLSGVITDETLQDFDRYSPAGGVTTGEDLAKGPADPFETAATPVSSNGLEGEEDVPLTAYLRGYVIIFAFALVAPWLAGFSNIIGWLIIGFGVYQAWSMNKYVPIEFKGPFDIKKR